MKWVRKMIASILPWPARGERKAAVDSARQIAAEAQEKAVQSESLSGSLREMRRKNHVTEALDMLIARKAREQ